MTPTCTAFDELDAFADRASWQCVTSCVPHTVHSQQCVLSAERESARSRAAVRCVRRGPLPATHATAGRRAASPRAPRASRSGCGPTSVGSRRGGAAARRSSGRPVEHTVHTASKQCAPREGKCTVWAVHCACCGPVAVRRSLRTVARACASRAGAATAPVCHTHGAPDQQCT